MSRIEQLQSLEAQRKKLDLEYEKLRGQVATLIDFSERVIKEAKEKGINLTELAIAIAPDLVKGGAKPKASTGAPRNPRKMKQYKNPNTGEIVETKGGNHKILKEWKTKHGAETVESWIQ